MAYVNVADWKSDQVADWLKGLDSVLLPYIKYFINTDVNGQKLLDMQPNDFDKIGMRKIGHQELLLEAVDLLRNFHYELDKENVQLLALRLSCSAHSLYKDIKQNYLNSTRVPTKILIDVANTVAGLKPLVNWLNRPPFCGQPHYISMKNDLLKLALEIVTSGQRDRFAENPVENIFEIAQQLAQHADYIIQESRDSLILQPATLDVASLKKRSGESLGFYIVPSFHGVHQVGEVKCNSVAHQCGKIEAGDEIVQVNYQTVVGWQARQVMALLEEVSTDIFLTLKKRPRHSKVFGQIYMKPYRLPSKKLFNYPQRYFDQLTPPRPSGLLTIPNFSFPVNKQEKIKTPKIQESQLSNGNLLSPPPTVHLSGQSISPEICSHSNSSSGDESELESANCSSPSYSARIYLPKPHIPVQRRATISGASPIAKHAPFNFDQCDWDKLKQNNEAPNNNKNNNNNSNEKSNSEMQLSKCTKPTKVHWTSLPPNEEKLECQKLSDKKLVDAFVKDDTLSSNNLICLKDQINQLKVNSNVEQNNKKPKIMPKPIISKVLKPIDNSSVTKVRGKLDKSFSTPSYDFSGDCNLRNNFEYFDTDLRISVEDIKNDDTENVTSSTVIKEEKIKRPDKPILTFPKPPPPKNDDSFKTTAEITSKKCINKSVKPVLYFPKPPPPKTADIDVSIIEDTDTIDNFGYEPQSSRSIDESSNKVSESSNGFSFDSKYVEHLESSTKSYLENQKGNIIDHDNVTAQLLFKNKVPVFIETTQFGTNHSKNKSYSNYKHHDQADFEISDLSDVCPPLSLTDLSGSDDNIFQVDTKDNISLPSERTAIGPHQAVLNTPATFPRQKAETKKFQPPIPPPRPSKPAELPKRTSYRAMLGAKAIGKKENKGQKQLLQRNPLIAKRRNISAKELGACEYQGWLYQRSKKISPRMQWIKGWFIIKGSTFYGFNNKESTKARLMIILSGFTVAIADEVKSKTNAFKVYHMGTMFYFAAESSDDLSMWLDWFSTATIADGHSSNIVPVSETDGEEDENFNDSHELTETSTSKPETTHESSFTSSALKNLSTFISNHMGSHANPSASCNKNKIDKSFNSLKKHQKKNSAKEDQVKGSSLDRKHWKFLGMGMIGRDSNEPVPTSQYRSYRRVLPTVPKCTSDASVLSYSFNQNNDILYPIPQTNHNRPADMVDYRLASIPKSDNNQRRTDSTSSAEITLESFIQSRQDERRVQHPHIGMRVPQYTAPPPPPGTREDQNQQFLDQATFRIAAESEPRSRQPITALASVDHSYNLDVLPSWLVEIPTPSNDLNGNRNAKSFPHQRDGFYMPQLPESHEHQLYFNQYPMDQTSDSESLEYPPVFEPETYPLVDVRSNRRDRSNNNNFETDCLPGNNKNYR